MKYKFLSVLLTITFIISLLQNFTYASNDNPLILDNNIGKILETYQPNNNKNSFYIIEDLHCNAPVQKNIKKILKRIEKKEQKIDLIGVEGSFGRLTPEIFRKIPRNLRTIILKALTSKAYLTGPELYAIETLDSNLMGIEDKDLYIKNFTMLYKNLMHREILQSLFTKLENIINKGKKILFLPSMQKFEEYKTRYKNDMITLESYLKILIDITQETQAYENIKNYLKLKDLEKNINLTAANLEADILTKKIAKKSNIKIEKFKRPDYKYLTKFLETNNIKYEDNYKDLSKLITYLKLKDKIDSSKLLNEKDILEHEASKKILKGFKDLTDLLYLEKFTLLFKGYINNKLSKPETELWESGKEKFYKVTENLGTKLGIKIDLKESFDLGNALNNMHKFYSLADKRNEAMVKNILELTKKMDKDSTTTVMIIGGFHSRGIRHILRAKGISYVLIRPNPGTQKIDDTIYINRLKSQAKLLNIKKIELLQKNHVTSTTNRFDNLMHRINGLRFLAPLSAAKPGYMTPEFIEIIFYSLIEANIKQEDIKLVLETLKPLTPDGSIEDLIEKLEELDDEDFKYANKLLDFEPKIKESLKSSLGLKKKTIEQLDESNATETTHTLSLFPGTDTILDKILKTYALTKAMLKILFDKNKTLLKIYPQNGYIYLLYLDNSTSHNMLRCEFIGHDYTTKESRQVTLDQIKELLEIKKISPTTLKKIFDYAVEYSNMNIIKFFVKDIGLDINLKDYSGYTPLDTTKDPIVSEYLKANGAKHSRKKLNEIEKEAKKMTDSMIEKEKEWRKKRKTEKKQYNVAMQIVRRKSKIERDMKKPKKVQALLQITHQFNPQIKIIDSYIKENKATSKVSMDDTVSVASSETIEKLLSHYHDLYSYVFLPIVTKNSGGQISHLIVIKPGDPTTITLFGDINSRSVIVNTGYTVKQFLEYAETDYRINDKVIHSTSDALNIILDTIQEKDKKEEAEEEATQELRLTKEDILKIRGKHPWLDLKYRIPVTEVMERILKHYNMDITRFYGNDRTKNRMLKELKKLIQKEDKSKEYIKNIYKAASAILEPEKYVKNGDSAYSHRLELFKYLDLIIKDRDYTSALQRYSSDSNKDKEEYKHLKLLYSMIEGLCTVNMTQFASKTVFEFIKKGGGAVDLNIDKNGKATNNMANVLEQDCKAIGDAPDWMKMDPLYKTILKLAGHANYGFTPNHQTNFFALWFIDQYADKKIKCLHMGTPTAKGRPGKGTSIISEFKLFLDNYKSFNQEGKPSKKHLYFNHQNPVRKRFWSGDETVRIRAIRSLEQTYPQNFLMFDFPMDTAFFKVKKGTGLGDRLRSQTNPNFFIEEFMKRLLNTNPDQDIRIPYEQIVKLDGEKYKINDIQRNIDQIVNAIHRLYFNNRVAPEDYQNFQLITYAYLQEYFCNLFNPDSYNSTCKDDMDRGGAMKAIRYYLHLIKEGKEKDPESLNHLRVILHAAALLIKSQPVLEHRGEFIVHVIKLCNGLTQAQIKNIQNYRLQSPEEDSFPKNKITIPSPIHHQDIYPTQTLAATADEKAEAYFIQPKLNKFSHEYVPHLTPEEREVVEKRTLEQTYSCDNVDLSHTSNDPFIKLMNEFIPNSMKVLFPAYRRSKYIEKILEDPLMNKMFFSSIYVQTQTDKDAALFMSMLLERVRDVLYELTTQLSKTKNPTAKKAIIKEIQTLKKALFQDIQNLNEKYPDLKYLRLFTALDSCLLTIQEEPTQRCSSKFIYNAIVELELVLKLSDKTPPPPEITQALKNLENILISNVPGSQKMLQIKRTKIYDEISKLYFNILDTLTIQPKSPRYIQKLFKALKDKKTEDISPLLATEISRNIGAFLTAYLNGNYEQCKNSIRRIEEIDLDSIKDEKEPIAITEVSTDTISNKISRLAGQQHISPEDIKNLEDTNRNEKKKIEDIQRKANLIIKNQDISKNINTFVNSVIKQESNEILEKQFNAINKTAANQYNALEITKEIAPIIETSIDLEIIKRISRKHNSSNLEERDWIIENRKVIKLKDDKDINRRLNPDIGEMNNQDIIGTLELVSVKGKIRKKIRTRTWLIMNKTKNGEITNRELATIKEREPRLADILYTSQKLSQVLIPYRDLTILKSCKVLQVYKKDNKILLLKPADKNLENLQSAA